MSDRYIPGVPCWVDTNQPDAQAAATFYTGLFGWEMEDVTPPGAPVTYLLAKLDGGYVAAIASQPPATSRPVAWDTYIWVDSADETAEKVRAAGGTVVSEPMDVGPAGRTATCADPDGAEFCLWQAGEHRGADVVNSPGSVNFNDLRARELGRAEEFYGAVFGWELLDVGGFTAWALPAYGDFLEERNPGNRARMAEFGGPARFEEVVATAAVTMERPRWGVTFAVAHADDAVARAEALGGRVLSGPVDAPWVRTAEIADPQGAVFTASQFVPPES
jgi:predicted enzyme related to lactoylglutathione lyase